MTDQKEIVRLANATLAAAQLLSQLAEQAGTISDNDKNAPPTLSHIRQRAREASKELLEGVLGLPIKLVVFNPPNDKSTQSAGGF